MGGDSKSPSKLPKKSGWSSVWDAGGIIILVSPFLLLIVYLCILSMDPTKLLPLLLGSLILICGYYQLIYKLPKMTKDIETSISMETLRASFWLVIFGLVIIVLGLLYLMGILPPTAWRT
jgi:Ca2+/Na+ antiporter